MQMAQDNQMRLDEQRERAERQRRLEEESEERRQEERARAERDERRHEQMMLLFMLAFGRKGGLGLLNSI